MRALCLALIAFGCSNKTNDTTADGLGSNSDGSPPTDTDDTANSTETGDPDLPVGCRETNPLPLANTSCV